jgi:YD repeat-containing protein
VPVDNVVRLDRETGSTAYTYDELDRLTRVCHDVPACGDESNFEAFTYDGAGNRLTRETPQGLDVYQYDDLAQLVEIERADGSTSEYGYDAGGRLTTVNGWTVFWDRNRSRPTQARSGPVGEGTERLVFSYGVDGALAAGVGDGAQDALVVAGLRPTIGSNQARIPVAAGRDPIDVALHSLPVLTARKRSRTG